MNVIKARVLALAFMLSIYDFLLEITKYLV